MAKAINPGAKLVILLKICFFKIANCVAIPPTKKPVAYKTKAHEYPPLDDTLSPAKTRKIFVPPIAMARNISAIKSHLIRTS